MKKDLTFCKKIKCATAVCSSKALNGILDFYDLNKSRFSKSQMKEFRVCDVCANVYLEGKICKQVVFDCKYEYSFLNKK